ncbi:MAG: CapA family protein [Cyanobacteria bacterium J06581_3]
MVSASLKPIEFASKATSELTIELATGETRESVDLSGLGVQQLAAEGYFQAIAYWLNEPLVPQNIYAQVLADTVAGRLKVLVEYERSPDPKKLLKFICSRLYQLNSNVIEGVHLIARAIGSGHTDWEQRVRIPSACQRKSLSTDKKQTVETQTVETQTAETQTTETQTAQEKLPQLMHESSRSKVARAVVHNQFTFFRAALMTGSATAAFLFGGLTELVMSERLSASVATEPAPVVAPWYDEETDATTVSYRAADRFPGRTVEAALETVAVIPHRDLVRPDDPTITLLFGGELGLNDFIFEEAQSLDQLFSELTIYSQADVAMVGLAEPLATASTSLQENFYHRTRPQAVQALKDGGIDIVNLASEGTLTYGEYGLDETLKTLDRQGIYRVGAGRNQKEAHRPEILEVKGQRIAYLGYNPEAIKAAKANQAGVALTNSKERLHILEDIRAIRPQVDWVVVNYRWGDLLGTDSGNANPEFSAIPEDWQQSLAHDAVDAGADLVVGYHPSQIQGAEIYRDRAIAYSLGDFVFSEAPLKDHDTAALRVSLRNQQMKVEFLPVSVRDSRIQMATGEQGTAILQGIRNASRTFDQPLHFPAVLKAPPVSSPNDTFIQSAPARPADPSLDTLPETLPALPNEPTDTVQPIPAEPLPDEYSAPSPEEDSIQYEAPAPHPTLRESEFLFSLEAERFEQAAPEPAAPEPAEIQTDAIAPHEEPLVGPLSAAPASTVPVLTAAAGSATRVLDATILNAPTSENIFESSTLMMPSQMLAERKALARAK